MINLGSVQLPINSATKTFGILAKRGAGKSYTGAVMAEEFYKNHIPFVVFDPIDVWYGLRISKNGKDKGLPIIVFGAENADIKLEKDMGKKIAQAIVKHNVSCVISTFGVPKNQQRQIITDFSEELIRINNTPRHVFIEEAHEFVPQRIWGDMGKTFNAVSNLVVMGRNRGIGVTLINQRGATINKDVLTQIDTLLAFRNVAPQDRKVLKEWVEFHSAKGDFEMFMESLPSLPTGEGWIWSPEFLGIFKKIKIRERETFHPDREKLGEKFEIPVIEHIDLQAFIGEFQKERKEIPLKEIRKIEERKDYQVEMNQMKNEYESKLIGKELEIQSLKKILENLRHILGVNQERQPTTPFAQSNLEMWIEKLGNNTGEARIIKFLSMNPTIKYNRQQITLGIRASYSSVKVWISRLKRALLIKEEGGFVSLNPEL